jgi:hypothetical protein
VREAFRATRGEIIFGLVLAAISYFLTNSVLPVALIVLPALLCVFLARKHNGDSPRMVRPELPAAVVAPARSAAEERHQLAALANEEPAESWSARTPALAGRR